MKINNVGEFFSFIKTHGLIGIAPEIGPLIVCMDEYGRLCPCDSIDVRTSKLKKCKTLYIEFARKANNYKSIILSKTKDNFVSFCSDNQPIITLTR